jgi:hypothetical protein
MKISFVFLAMSLFAMSAQAVESKVALDFANGISGRYQNKFVGKISSVQIGQKTLTSDCSDITISAGSPDSSGGGKIKAVNIDINSGSSIFIPSGYGYYVSSPTGLATRNNLVLMSVDARVSQLGDYSSGLDTTTNYVRFVKDDKGNLKSISLKNELVRDFDWVIYSRTVNCKAL